jgi:hypothetical protein
MPIRICWQGSPGEGDDHPGELVDGPEADQLGIVEVPGYRCTVSHGYAPSQGVTSVIR